MHQSAPAHHREAIRLVAGQVAGANGQAAAVVQPDGRSPLLGLGQVGGPLLVVPMEAGLQPSAARGDEKRSPAHVLGLDVQHPSVGGLYRAFHGHGLSVLVLRLEGHAVFHALQQVAALGIERHLQVVFLHTRQPRLRPLVHAAGIVVAGRLGLTVDGEHATVEPVPDAKVVVGHLAVVEPPGVVAPVAVLAHVEVEHPARIGPQLVVAAVERVAQGELSAGVARGTDDNPLALHQQPVGREQLYIEQTAHVRGPQVVGTHHVGLVPQGVAHEVALIVGVYIYLLLHLGRTAPLQGLAERVETAGSTSRQGG